MAAKTLKVSFTLDQSDVAYFRKLFRDARRNVAGTEPSKIVRRVRDLISEVREAKKAPGFVREAIKTLEDLLQLLEDEEYAVPKPVATRALAALAYFANPADLIPDHLPGLGFLDDAIMIRLVEDEFRHELWGYRKFRDFRAGSEQRYWTPVARKRMAERLVAKRREMRAKIEEREAKEKQRAKHALGW